MDVTKKYLFLILCVIMAMFIINAVTIYQTTSLIRTSAKETYYDTYSTDAMAQNLTKTVGDFCIIYDNNLEKVKCVYNFITTTGIFNYTVTQQIILPDDLLTKGGDCKSWSTFYSAVFKYMGLDTKPIPVTGHIYVNVYDKDFYCNVDQLHIECHKYPKRDKNESKN